MALILLALILQSAFMREQNCPEIPRACKKESATNGAISRRSEYRHGNKRKVWRISMTRVLIIITVVSLTVGSGVAYAMGVGAASGFSWNQAAADASARAWAAEGWCFTSGWFPWGFPCAALQPSLHPAPAHTRKHNHQFAN
jgi:hypothetical protein